MEVLFQTPCTYLFMHKSCFSAKAQTWAGVSVTWAVCPLSKSRIAGGVRPAQQKQRASHRAWVLQGRALPRLGIVCSAPLTAFPSRVAPLTAFPSRALFAGLLLTEPQRAPRTRTASVIVPATLAPASQAGAANLSSITNQLNSPS